MNEITLRGTHYEMGRQFGEHLRRKGSTFEGLGDESVRFTDSLVGQVEGLIPNLLDEIRGIADGGGYDEGILRFHALALGIVPACTVIAISGRHTADGRTLFGRNYDASPEFADFTLYKTYPDRGFSHIGCCYGMLVGREGGVNEAGLAIAVTGVQGHYSDASGLWDHIPVRAVLEQCETVGEAAELLQALPHLWTKNFLVADARGGIAIVEAAQQDVVATRPSGGFGAITNHFVSPTMTAYCNDERVPANSRQRRTNARHWFEAGTRRGDKPDLSGLKGLLCDTEQGVRSELDDNFATVWSWVSALGERRFELADRFPEPDRYRVVEF
jgi:predicted choloylglycine hydrolase